jgi:hypothetical protein
MQPRVGPQGLPWVLVGYQKQPYKGCRTGRLQHGFSLFRDVFPSSRYTSRMSAPGEKKRPWFQFHLSTAVLLMFVASGLLWLNCSLRLSTCESCILLPSGLESQFMPTWAIGRGWPVLYAMCWGESTEPPKGRDLENLMPSPDEVPIFNGQLRAVIPNAACSVILLLLAAVLCEYLIRRKEHKS